MTDTNELFDKKLIILLILNESNTPLSLEQIVKMCSDFESITYFDVCEYVDVLKRTNHIAKTIENSTSYYSLTETGFSTLNELLELVPGISIHTIKKMLYKQMNKIKKGYEINSQILPIKHGEYKISCYIKDGNDELLNITIYAGDVENAKNISDNWKNDANNIYMKIIELMTGN